MLLPSMAFSLVSLALRRSNTVNTSNILKRSSLTRSIIVTSNKACISISPVTTFLCPTTAAVRTPTCLLSSLLVEAEVTYCTPTTPTTRTFSTAATRTQTQTFSTSATQTQRLSQQSEEPEDDEMFPNFTDLPALHPTLRRNVAAMKFQTMTEIQAKTWEAASAGTDVLGRARTGTGKTVAFLLPALQQLLTNFGTTLPKDTVHLLVLSPTRELAAQIGDQAQQLVSDNSNNSNSNRNGTSSLTVQVVFGGASKPKDIKAFERRVPSILVATPGRLRDHLQTTVLHNGSTPFAQLLSQTSILVLDETDRLLDMGFKREVEDIISYLPNKNQRQTLLFSATVPPEVKAVMAKTMRSDYVTVDCIHDTDPASHTNKQVEQTHVIVPAASRLVTGTVDILHKLIRDTRDAGEPLKLVVFFNTAHLVAFYAALFNDGMNVKVLELHSRKSQAYRTRTADAFRAADQAILFTSDVSARGVDYPGVTDVVQFGIPDSRESYIHRLGRTGRAGKQGEGLLVLSDLERKFLNQLSGLDVAENKGYQTLIDAPPSPLMMQKLGPVLAAIHNESDKDLASNARAAYRSMLGFYNGKLAKLGVPGTDRLVEFVNGFSQQAGLHELPELEIKTIKKMGLVGANGLNIVKNASVPSNGQNRGGGGRGGGGRGSFASSNNNNNSYGGDGGDRGGSSNARSGGGRGGRGDQGGGRGGGPRFSDGGRRGASTVAQNNPVSPMKRHISPANVGAPAANFTKKPRQEVSEGAQDGSGAAPKSNNRRRRNGRGAGVKAEAS